MEERTSIDTIADVSAQHNKKYSNADASKIVDGIKDVVIPPAMHGEHPVESIRQATVDYQKKLEKITMTGNPLKDGVRKTAYAIGLKTPKDVIESDKEKVVKDRVKLENLKEEYWTEFKEANEELREVTNNRDKAALGVQLVEQVVTFLEGSIKACGDYDSLYRSGQYTQDGVLEQLLGKYSGDILDNLRSKSVEEIRIMRTVDLQKQLMERNQDWNDLSARLLEFRDLIDAQNAYIGAVQNEITETSYVIAEVNRVLAGDPILKTKYQELLLKQAKNKTAAAKSVGRLVKLKIGTGAATLGLMKASTGYRSREMTKIVNSQKSGVFSTIASEIKRSGDKLGVSLEGLRSEARIYAQQITNGA